MTGAKAKAGIRVTKGNDWSCDDEAIDKVITSCRGMLIAANNATGWWTVDWYVSDHHGNHFTKRISEHRVGFEGFYDLKL